MKSSRGEFADSKILADETEARRREPAIGMNGLRSSYEDGRFAPRDPDRDRLIDAA